MTQIFYRDPDTKVFHEIDPEKLWAELIIAGVPHEEVSYRNVDGSLQGTVELDDSGQATIEVEVYDTYYINEEHEIVVDVAKQYIVSLQHIWTTVLDLNNPNFDDAFSYTHDAYGHATGWEAWKDEPFFRDIKPCLFEDGEFLAYVDPNDYNQTEDGMLITDLYTGSTSGTGSNIKWLHDIMIKIPKFGYKIEKTVENKVLISLTTDANLPGFCYLAHALENPGDCDEIYIGAYIAGIYSTGATLISSSPESGYYYSPAYPGLSGVMRTLGVSLQSLRDSANQRGEGFQLMSFYVWTLLECLYLMVFQNIHGYRTERSSYSTATLTAPTTTTRKTNTFGMFSFADNKNYPYIKCFGMEYLWGEWYTLCDGVYIDNNNIMYTNYKDFENPLSGQQTMLQTAPQDGGLEYLTDVVGNNKAGFMVSLPQANVGSSTTYFETPYSKTNNNIDNIDSFQYLVGSKNSMNPSYSGSGRPASMFEIKICQQETPALDTCTRLVYKKKAS